MCKRLKFLQGRRGGEIQKRVEGSATDRCRDVAPMGAGGQA